MGNCPAFRIEMEAVRQLADWKKLFSEQVSLKARELARADGVSELITQEHFQQAASIAVQILASAIRDADPNNDCRKAA